MLFTSIPFEYAKLLEPGDRVRKPSKPTTSRRVRGDRKV
jgi:hypothetical protein